MEADYFVGLLGERYGWVPDHDTLMTALEILSIPDSGYSDLSVTSIEMMLALKTKEASHCFFFFRDESFQQ